MILPGINKSMLDADDTTHFACFGVIRGDLLNQQILAFSDRAWIEDEDGVRFLKHRRLPTATPPDLTEFMWVKLKSRSIR